MPSPKPRKVTTLMSSKPKLNTLAERVIFRRKQLKLSQPDLAQLCNISQAAVHKIETGGKSVHIVVVARALQVTAEWLEFGDEFGYHEFDDTLLTAMIEARTFPKAIRDIALRLDHARKTGKLNAALLQNINAVIDVAEKSVVNAN